MTINFIAVASLFYSIGTGDTGGTIFCLMIYISACVVTVYGADNG